LITGTRPDNGCQDFRRVIGLHVAYTASQLQYATRYLQANPRTGLAPMTVGANDLFLLIDWCDANPNGQLMAVTYYATNYNDPAEVAVITALDATIAGVTRAFDGRVADGVTAFRTAVAPFGGDSCAAGLLIRLTPTSCNIHPLAGGCRAARRRRRARRLIPSRRLGTRPGASSAASPICQ
jgi:hypothetical protein